MNRWCRRLLFLAGSAVMAVTAAAGEGDLPRNFHQVDAENRIFRSAQPDREEFLEPLDQRENFLAYMAYRPGVQKEGDHGLWDAGGKVPNLSPAVRQYAAIARPAVWIRSHRRSRISGRRYGPAYAVRRRRCNRADTGRKGL